MAITRPPSIGTLVEFPRCDETSLEDRSQPLLEHRDARLIVVGGPHHTTLPSRRFNDASLSVPQQNQTRTQSIRQLDGGLQRFGKLIQEPLQSQFLLPGQQDPFFSRRPLEHGLSRE